MAVTSQEQNKDSYPLLMERGENHENQHVIDVERQGDDETSSSDSSDNSPTHGLSPSPPGVSAVHSGPISNTVGRRGERVSRHRWSPFDTLLWVSIELVFTLGQIVAAIVVLSASRNENPHTPLFAWIVGYAAGCAASLPLLYWRYLHRNQPTEQGSAQARQAPPEGSPPPESNSYITISFARSPEEETRRATSSDAWNGLNVEGSNSRLHMFVDHFKMALDCFYAVWFVVGNVWVFGGHSSSTDAPNLYRLCIVFLTFSCISYAMPFILCGMICCCLPCIISVLGVREDMNQMRGASEDSINALPTHKFKLKKGNDDCKDGDSGVGEGGILAAGTDKERIISADDAVCCICLTKYTDNDVLRELPCTHFFHVDCVDKWLKINATCPLCKFEINETPSTTTTTTQGSNHHQQT